ncbi:hypothetical protein DL93DRAFT_2091199 [Clavulina sp. PMI_390]|nr:hypothetical protein DL93DRAFT_2091199 [Clavulina sp. PMI_390]
MSSEKPSWASAPEASEPKEATPTPSIASTKSWQNAFEKAHVHRGLRSRHLQMISLAGMIGTGLFLSSGAALADSGPVGALIGYTFMAFITGAVAVSSGEMAAFMPVAGGFVRHTAVFVDRSLAVTVGWNFWYDIALTQAVEIVAASGLAAYWAPNVNAAVWISLFWALIVIVNLTPVRVYGETEFFFACLKICLIIGLLLVGFLIDVGAVPGQERLGFRYWAHPGPFVNLTYAGGSIPGATGKFLATWATLVNAAFAYKDIQIVGMSGSESRNPRRAIPKATRRTFIRLGCFYVLTIFIMSLIVPANSPELGKSDGTAATAPFVIAIKLAGIKTLPGIVNAVVMTSAFSSGCSCVFFASRTLLGLANDGMAHRVFLTTNRFGTPYVAVLVSSLFGSAAYLSVQYNSMQALIWLLNLSTVAGLISFVIICLTSIRMQAGMKAQGYSREELPYASWGQPYTAWFGMFWSGMVVFFSGFQVFLKGNWRSSTFLSSYLSLFIFIGVYFAVKVYHKTLTKWWTPAAEIDLAYLFDLLRAERAEEAHENSSLTGSTEVESKPPMIETLKGFARKTAKAVF